MALVKLLVRDEENKRTLQLFLTPEQRDRACSDESYVEQLMQEHDLNKTEEARNYASLLSDTFRQKIFFEAFVVLGQFLVLKKDKELFQEWMKETCSANSKQSADCYQCLKDWCDEFL